MVYVVYVVGGWYVVCGGTWYGDMVCTTLGGVGSFYGDDYYFIIYFFGNSLGCVLL